MSLIESLKDYFRSSQAELQKVNWPSRQETLRYTALVIGVSLVLAAFFATLDLGLNKVLDAALSARKAPIQQQVPVTSDNAVPVDVTTSSVPGLDIKPIEPTTPAPTPAPAQK